MNIKIPFINPSLNHLSLICRYALFFFLMGTMQLVLISSVEASTTYESSIFDDKEHQTPFMKAIKAEDIKSVKSLIHSGLDVNETNKYGCTPLMAAVYKGNVKIISLLIKKGANLESYDHDGNTAFMYAFYGTKQKEAAVEFLLALNVNIQIMNNQEQTPLILAVLNNHCKSIELLISSGADIEAKGKSGQTALIHAIGNQIFNSVELLIRLGANLETRDQWSFTPLMAATLKNDGAMIRILLKAGADIHACTTQVVPVSIQKTLFDLHPKTVSIPKDSSALDIAKQFDKRVAENALTQMGNTQ